MFNSMDEGRRSNAVRCPAYSAVFAQRITVRVEGGRVFLYGEAYSLEERANLETLALSVPGVSTVENHLCVNLFA
jgi:osmotically-inducible protein OsmY